MNSVRRLSWCIIGVSIALSGCSEDDNWPIGIEGSAMDQTIDPCEDFYRYACGGFIDENPVPSDGAYVARRSMAFFAAQDVQRQILSAPGPDADGVALRAYNQACLDAGSGKQNRSALDGVLAQIDAAQTPADFAKAVAALHAVGGWAFFSFWSTRDFMHPGTLMAAVGDAELTMPDRAYYFDTTTGALPAMRKHIEGLAQIVGVDDPKLADAVIKIETAIAAAVSPVEDQRDPASTFHPTDRAAFEATAPSFDWSAYHAAIGAPAFTTIDVVSPPYFEKMEALLKGTSQEELRSYMRWIAVEAFAGAMSDAAVEEEDAFHQGVFYGAPTPLPRDEYCVRLTLSALPWSMSKKYVERAFATTAKVAAKKLGDDVRGALDAELDRALFLDAETRAAAKAKLQAMSVEVGGPETYPSVAGLALDPSSFVATRAALRSWNFARGVKAIGTEDAGKWFLAPAFVNAAYSPTRNVVNLPAAILQSPYFDASFGAAVNYGAMGSVVGHEMTHGFDDIGRLFDATGKLQNFWTKGTEAAFEERAQCLVEQYDAIEVLPGQRVNGSLTLGENIADLGGVKLAYAALAASEETDKRAFFLAYAQSMCSNVNAKTKATLLLTDPHAPDGVRVNAVLANVPAFAEAFSCSEGSPMAPEKRCEVW